MMTNFQKMFLCPLAQQKFGKMNNLS